MKPRKLVFVALSLMLTGCNKTRPVGIISDTQMNLGQQMACIYVAESLYCTPKMIKQEDIDMKRVVFAVREIRSHLQNAQLSGTYSTKFGTHPRDYSFWNCTKTGEANPAVTCVLLKDSDSKQTAEGLKLVEFEDSVLRSLDEKRLVDACGEPRSIKSNSNWRTLMYAASHTGILIEATFSLSRSEPKVDMMTPVDEKTLETSPEVTPWLRDVPSPEAVKTIREYLPCLKEKGISASR
jgi:hypothetical protein